MEDVLEKSLRAAGIMLRPERFRVEGPRFPERSEPGVYRVVQGLISIRPSATAEASVQLVANQQGLILVVEDHGRGFDNTKKKKGNGMLNISSRVSTLKVEIN